MPFNGTQRHKDTKDDDYDDDYDFLSFVLRLSFFVPIIFWSGYALEIEYKIKQIIVGASVNKILKIILKIISSEAPRKKSLS